MLLNGGTYNGVQILRPATVKFLGGHTLSAVQQAGFDNWIGLEGFSYGNLMRVLVDPTRAVTLGSKGEFGWDGWLGCYMEGVPEKNMTFLISILNSSPINVIYSCISLKNYRKNRTIKSIFIVERLIY